MKTTVWLSFVVTLILYVFYLLSREEAHTAVPTACPTPIIDREASLSRANERLRRKNAKLSKQMEASERLQKKRLAASSSEIARLQKRTVDQSDTVSRLKEQVEVLSDKMKPQSTSKPAVAPHHDNGSPGDTKHKYEWVSSSGSLVDMEDIVDDFEGRGICESENSRVFTIDGVPINGPLPELLAKHFQGKKVVLIGDSLMKQLLEWLIISLDAFQVEHSVSHLYYDAQGGELESCKIVRGEESMSPAHCSIRTLVTVERFSLQVSHFFHYGIELPGGLVAGTRYNLLTRNNLRAMLREHDVALVNAASHMDDEPGHVFARVMRYLRAELRGHPGGAYMLALPTHFLSDAWDSGEYSNRSPGELQEACAGAADRHWTDALARGLLRNSVSLLDMYPVLRERGDSHSTEGYDCGHYCYSYELFYPFWWMLAQITGPHAS